MSRSGWCVPWNHPTDHATCQQRQDEGLLPPCSCPDHGGHTAPTTTSEDA